MNITVHKHIFQIQRFFDIQINIAIQTTIRHIINHMAKRRYIHTFSAVQLHHRSLDALKDAVVKLYMDEVLPSVRAGLCAAIYTQVSDVEDEINGLLTYDRKVEKLQSEDMLPVAKALQEAVEA